MIDVSNEEILTFAQAAKRAVGRRGRGVHVSAIHRWASKGVDAGGHQAILESALYGGTRVTSVEALERFVERCTNPNTDKTSRSIRQRDRAAAEAGDELAAMGV